MGDVVSPGSAREALGMLKSAMGYLAAADATAMAAETQAQCLQALEQLTSVGTAARTSILAAFTSGQGYSADADYSPRAWLIHKTRVTPGTAVGYTAWVRRAAAHPEIAAALAAGDVAESVARTICAWTGKLPARCQEDADAILLAAAKGGADIRDLAMLAGEIYGRSQSKDQDEDAGQDQNDGKDQDEDAGQDQNQGDGKDQDEDAGQDQGDGKGTDEDEVFDDRSVKLETTFQGAGVVHGDLTPECAAIVGTVLDALSAPAGAEDTRTKAQRCHDALQDAMQRLVTAGLLPERAGQPVKAWVHISLADLMMLEGSSALQAEWTSRVRARWAGYRAEASAGGGVGGAWLDGDAARAVTCDAAMAPFVTGEVNPAALEDLVRLCVQLDRLRRHHGSQDGTDGDGSTGGGTAGEGTGTRDTAADQAAPAADTTLAWEALERAIIGKAVDLLSGPGGLASFLRRRQLGARLGGTSLPLDIGFSESIPAGIRNAVTLRDKHCRWAGGCNQPAAACQVHHVKHKKNGGKTSVRGCVLLCFFHHQVVIHRWGWTLVLNPDGTTTAWNPDKTKILHSHGPPARPG